MSTYKHTQVSYIMFSATLILLVFFTWVQITARAELPSENSGTNFAVTAIMLLVLVVLVSFSTLTVSIEDRFLKLRFGWGIFRKNFLINEIAMVNEVKNKWYFGWGIRVWFWPKMIIYNVSGFNAVELKMKNGKIFRIGTNEPTKLADAVKQGLSSG